MEKTKARINNIFIIIGLLFFFIAFLVIKQRNREIEKSTAITVGYIYYTGSNLQYGSKYCKYEYYVNEVKYEGVKSFYTSEFDVKKRSYYEVIYDPQNPNNSDIKLKNKIPVDSVCTYFVEECPFNVPENNQ